MTANIASSFDAAAVTHADKTVLVGGQRSYTWQDLDLKAGAVAGFLQSKGILQGQRVAICFDDPLDTIIGVFGGLKAGFVITPFNARLKPDERDQVLSLLNPAIVPVSYTHLTLPTSDLV